MKKQILKTIVAFDAIDCVGGMINMIVNPDDYVEFFPNFKKLKGLWFDAVALEFIVMTELYKKLNK